MDRMISFVKFRIVIIFVLMLLVCLSNFGLEYHNVDEIPSRITSSDQCKLTGLGKGEGMDARK